MVTARTLALRNALVDMSMRYGASKQRMAYAESAKREHRAERARRAGRRQFAAIQRLADALAELST